MRSASASLLYEKLEPLLNAGEVELLDQPTLIEQLVSLVWRGQKISHEASGHDDWATACALAVSVARAAITRTTPKFVQPGIWSKTSGWISDPLGGGTRSTTQAFYDYYNNGGGGAHWPGSGPRDW